MAQHGTTSSDPAEAILAAVGRLGQATPRDIAAEAGVAYSTTTRNLRELAAAGHAQKLTDDTGRTLWRLPQPDTDAIDADATEADSIKADSIEAGAPGDTARTAEGDADTGVAPPAVPDADAGGSDPVQAAALPTPAAEPVAGVGEAATDPVGDAEPPAGTGQPADPAAAEPTDAADAGGQRAAVDRAQEPATPTDTPVKPRRASGTLDGAVLDILEAHPEQGFKVSQLCKLIDATNEGSDTAKASPGAVVLAAQRLARKGRAVLTVEKPATFQLAQASGE
jgi:hypothetical protein